MKYYKQALIEDSACQEAFNKLIRNNLLLDQEKSDLLESLKFSRETLWLKDFYQSKIEK